MTITMTQTRSHCLLLFVLAAVFLSSSTTLAGGTEKQASPPSRGLVAPGVPELPVRAASGGEVLLDVEVTPDGEVTDIRVLRTTPPFTEAVLEAVRGWRFEALSDTEEPSAERVLVAALFRAPSFYSATSAGTPPVDVGSSTAVAFPTEMVAPPYPPNASGDGVVLAEARIGARGEVLEVEIRAGGPPFDAAALEGLRGFRFRPAPGTGGSRPSAIVIFGFREPVVNP